MKNHAILYRKSRMVSGNAEIEASRERGNKETGKCRADSNQRRRSGQTSKADGSESLTIHRNDRTRRDFVNSCGQATLGGMFNRLISKTRYQIEESEKRTADLKQQLAELQQISDEFFQEDSK